MEFDTTLIYEMALKYYGHKWREEIEKDMTTEFARECGELKEQILPNLNKETAELLQQFEIGINNYLDEVYYWWSVKMFSLAVEIGMQLQQMFDRRDIDN